MIYTFFRSFAAWIINPSSKTEIIHFCLLSLFFEFITTSLSLLRSKTFPLCLFFIKISTPIGKAGSILNNWLRESLSFCWLTLYPSPSECLYLKSIGKLEDFDLILYQPLRIWCKLNNWADPKYWSANSKKVFALFELPGIWSTLLFCTDLIV